MLAVPNPVPPPLAVSEAEALAFLRTVAVMHGGQVNRLVWWPLSGGRHEGFNPVICGYYIFNDADAGDVRGFETAARWCWLRYSGSLSHTAPRNLPMPATTYPGRFIPGGRIDRGLGAIT